MAANALAANVDEVRALTQATIQCALKFISDSPTRNDKKAEYTVHLVTLSADGDYSLISNDWTGGSSQYSSFYNTLPGQPGPITFATLGADVISTFKFPNYFSGAGGSYPTTQVLLNVQNLLAGLKKLDGTPNYTAGTGTYLFANSLPQFNAINSYRVRERTWICCY